MNPSAFSLRPAVVFSALLSSALLACAPVFEGDSSPLDEAPVLASSEPAEAAPIDMALGLDGTAGVSSRVLMSAEDSGISLELVDASGANQLVIHPQGAASYKVSRLENPTRVVIDLPGTKTSANRSFDTSDAELLDRVRIGSYPDKTRIVLDLPEQSIGHQVTKNEANDIVVALSRDGSPIALPVEPAPAAEAPVIAQEPMARPAIEKAEAPKMETIEPAAATVPAATITALELQAAGAGENLLMVHSSGLASEPKLEQTAPSEYVLTITDASLSEAANTALLAPPASGVIRSVRPMAEGNKIQLRIFAQPGKRLKMNSSSDLIVIATDSARESMRAQMAPEKPAEAPSAPAAKNPAPAAPAPSVEDLEVSALLQEAPKYTGRLISLDLQDTDIDNALRIIAEVSNLNIIASEDVAGKVTLRLIDVPWDQALDVILKTQGLDKVQEGNVIRIAPVEKLRAEREALKQAQQAEQELEPLQVRYIRVSYARAGSLQPLVQSVLSERGTVSYDERSNQLIVKDIRSGLRNVAELVGKIDLRTPQVLLETQIVEATRSFERQLGAELGFRWVESPATGNATGWNFPNSIIGGGSASDSTLPGAASSYAVSSSSAITFLLDSADGTKSLATRLTALEQEGRVRVISRPAVATTNNESATIKAIERIRVKLPSGGVSVATGEGASAAGGSATATEKIEIGIVLNVKPQASPDYFVLLDIDAKSSSLGQTTVDGIPSEIERSATSTVLVSSGQTFAMGGIYKISENNDSNGTPFLKDVPVLGTFFRQSFTRNRDEELLFFITPRIVEGSFDDAAMRAAL